MSQFSKVLTTFFLASCLQSNAAVTIDIKEVGNDVVVSGSGSIDSFNTLLITNQNYSLDTAIIYPYQALIVSNGFTGKLYTASVDSARPNNFGILQGSATAPTFSSGYFGISGGAGMDLPGEFVLPLDYEQGDPISFEMIFVDRTLRDLGMDIGSYKWAWGSEQDGDKITLNVIAPEAPVQPNLPTSPTPVPTIGAFGLIGMAFSIFAFSVSLNRWRKK